VNEDTHLLQETHGEGGVRNLLIAEGIRNARRMGVLGNPQGRSLRGESDARAHGGKGDTQSTLRVGVAAMRHRREDCQFGIGMGPSRVVDDRHA
jgi:hypothetical protein